MLSILAGVMITVGGDGARSGVNFEGLVFLAGPPITLLAGICLIRRQRWAWFYMILLFSAVFIHSSFRIAQGPTPQSTSISPGGVPTTVLASTSHGSIPVMVVSLGLLAFLLSRRVRSDFKISNP